MQRARCATAGPASIMCIFSESNGSERQGGVVVGGGGGVSPTQTLLARGRASAVLALAGNPASVAELFKHSDWRVRRAAADYFVANPRRTEIASLAKSVVTPAGELNRADEQVKHTVALLDEISGFPEPMRPWRARLILAGRSLIAGERILLEKIAGKPDPPSF